MGFVVSEAGIDGGVWEVLGQQSIDFGQHVHISLFGGGPHIVGRHISGVIYPIDLVVLPDVIEGTQNEAFGANWYSKYHLGCSLGLKLASVRLNVKVW